ncbi:AraC family transcriptional regulator [Hirschia litorea]|uniref:AraC family transcriptional regulator n=1 Tax=Hirschia litorea TaxID=1199156 RepID=A0ABW2IPD5_9PROT
MSDVVDRECAEPRELNRFVVRNTTISPLGGLRIAGILEASVGVIETSRVFTRYSIAYIISGKGYYTGKTTGDFVVSSGDAILVRPNEEHCYRPDPGTVWSELFFEFEGPVFDLWFEETNFDWGNPVKKLEPIAYWKDRFLHTIGEENNGFSPKMLAECLRIQTLLADIQNASHSVAVEEMAWLEEAKKALIDHANGKEAADALALNYEVFRKRFKKLTGLSPGKYRNSLVMDKACQMMDDDEVTIRSIAEELGFCDEYHFSKQFKRTIGWTPRDFRNRFCGDNKLISGYQNTQNSSNTAMV